MIAIVDRQPERRVVIGPAAPACLARGLVQHDVVGPASKAHRRREPGKSGANDMDNGFGSSKEPVAQNRQEDAMAGRANARARRREAAPFQAGENGAIDVRHDSWRADACARAARHDPARLAEMRLGPRDGRRAGVRQRRIGENRERLVLADTRGAEILARQVEPADRERPRRDRARYW